MVDCEICGSREANTKASIEGAVLNVCSECVSLGKEMPRIVIKKKRGLKMDNNDKNVVRNLGNVVKQERTKRGLKHDELAEKVGEKASVIRRVESGWRPAMNVVKKLERFFSIKLMEEETGGQTLKKEKTKDLTIGDIADVS